MTEVKLPIHIVYFSGTGGTAFIARKLFDYFSMLNIHVKITELNWKNRQTIKKKGTLILLFPVHACDAPEPVRTFLGEPQSGWEKAAVLSVSGGGAIWPNNDCRRRSIRRLEQAGVPVFYEDMLMMPSNWILPTPEAVFHRLHEAAAAHCQIIADEIYHGIYRRFRTAYASAAVSWMAYIERAGARRFGQKIRVSADCTGCAWCLQNCPTGNIKLDGRSRPVFYDTCSICMRCMYGCPANALEPGFMNVFYIRSGFSMNRAIHTDISDETCRPNEAKRRSHKDANRISRELKNDAPGLLWAGLRSYIAKYEQ